MQYYNDDNSEISGTIIIVSLLLNFQINWTTQWPINPAQLCFHFEHIA